MSPETLGKPPAEWRAPKLSGRETKELYPEDLPPEPEKPKPPLEPGEEFSPEKDVGKIRQAPREQRKERLEKFKERLVYQKGGLAATQTQLIEKIQQNPDIRSNQLFEWVRDLGAKCGISQEQLATAGEMIDLYNGKHTAVCTAREAYPQDQELYEAVFAWYLKER